MSERTWRAAVVLLLAAICLQLGGASAISDGWRAFSRWSGLAGKEEPKPAAGSGGLLDSFYEENLKQAQKEAAEQAASAASR